LYNIYFVLVQAGRVYFSSHMEFAIGQKVSFSLGLSKGKGKGGKAWWNTKADQILPAPPSPRAAFGGAPHRTRRDAYEDFLKEHGQVVNLD
jgi:hypothetical protein